MGFTAEQIIPRTPDEVWKIVTDWGVAEYWLGVTKLRLLDKKKRIKAGSTLIFKVRSKDHVTTIRKWHPPKALSLESVQGGITVHYRYTFEPIEGGTRATLQAHCSAEHWFWKMLLPPISLMMSLSDRKQLEALDRLVRVTTGSGK